MAPGNNFYSSRSRVMLSSFAYALVDGLLRRRLDATEHSRLRFDTLRRRLIKITARVGVKYRQVVFYLCSHCPPRIAFNQ
ncbi:MAG TPA: hypothetical protein DDZ51_00470 [Planctomycetaceae bacterium]|nr:hypothetical protein [Planctomycetaceae bacterium]